MLPATPANNMAGSLRLFRLSGITVHVHWSWLLVAFLVIRYRADDYNSQIWNVAEYLALFAIVLMHEFGHAFACRQVGGKAEQILLWPLGGVAYVSPPPRPGAWLWSIIAGPLVNVVLLPITFAAFWLSSMQGLDVSNPDLHHFFSTVLYINFVLLVFNMLPVYPLDGGQVLQALLWFAIGRVKSLRVVSVIGMVVAVCAIGSAIVLADLWLGILAFFVATRAFAGFRQAKMLEQLEQLPRHNEVACPACREAPYHGDFWSCPNCQTRFDIFDRRGTCPSCGLFAASIPCPFCREANKIQDWFAEAHRPRSG